MAWVRRFTLWLIVTVCAGACIGAGALALIPQPALVTATNGAPWASRFSECLTSSASTAAQELAQECVTSLVWSAIESGQVHPMMEGLAAADASTPGFHVVCHGAGHRAGQRAFEQDGDVGSLLRKFDSTACAYALGHGVLDGFALSAPSDQEFVDAVRACEGFAQARGEIFTACADGMGHASWTSTDSFPAAFERCLDFSVATAQSLCAEGVIMQVYEPVAVEASRPIDFAGVELPLECANPSLPESLALGCHAGAGYVYSRPWWVLEGRASAAASGLAASPPPAAAFVEEATRIAALCANHTGQSSSSCTRGALAQIPPTVRASPALLAEVCGHLAVDLSECRASRT